MNQNQNQIDDQPAQPAQPAQPKEAQIDINTAMIAVPLKLIMLAHNHLSFAIKAGAYNNCDLNEIKSVVDNTTIMGRLLPSKDQK